MQERDSSIDIMRSIGLCCIILAHVSPPLIIFQLRNFDVPLMVFLSGYLFGNRKVKIESFQAFCSYLGKRCIRLVLPVWIFILLFVGIQFVFPQNFTTYYLNYPDKLWSSFLLMEGIGYVWIIRIFLCIAVLGPLCVGWIRNPKSLFILYLAYEILYLLTAKYMDERYFKPVNELFFYTVGFFLFFVLGAQYKSWTVQARRILALLALTILLTAGIWKWLHDGDLLILQDYKYPPRLYYSYYACLCFVCLFSIRDQIGKWESPILNFVGSSTIWIYLWHILFLQLFKFDAWYINFMLIFGCAAGLTWLQQQLVYAFVRISHVRKEVANTIYMIFCS